jgi:dihydrofolate reductase
MCFHRKLVLHLNDDWQLKICVLKSPTAHSRATAAVRPNQKRNNDQINMSRKLILYIATSLDGYIAQPNDDLSFLSIVDQEGQDYGYADFVKTVDTVIVGRKTYDKVTAMGFEFPHADKDAYIITRTPKKSSGSVHFYTEDLKLLVEKLKSENGKNIYCDGGAEIVNELLKADLIDEFIISVIPILVGNGTKLFNDGRSEMKLELASVKSFDKGLIQMHYKRTEDWANIYPLQKV